MFARFRLWLRRLLGSSQASPAPLSDTIVSPEEFRRIVLRERARSDRNGGSLSLLLLDGGGDRRLAEQVEAWAATVAQRVRCTDAVGWYDGATLGVVLPDTDHEGALMFVRALRARLPADAAKARWRVLVHPEHTGANFSAGAPPSKGRTPESGGPGSDGGADPLDLLRAPSRPAPAARREVASLGAAEHRAAMGSGRGSSGQGGGAQVRSRSWTSRRAPRVALAAVPSTQVDESQAGHVTDVELGDLSSLLLVREPPLKRLVDVLGALTGLLLLSPVMLVAALAVKLSSPGPILFRQQRAGLGGRAFTFYKFRTMVADAEQRKRELLARNEQTGPVFKIAADPRITPVGRLLRRTSIDELPQLWNVLVGDMSLVGPRPPILAEVKDYQRWQRRRLEIKGGLTCIWQVSGRSSIQFEDWVRLDLRYSEQASVWTDARLLARTVPAVLTCRGAH